jgi:hypothetical protein
MSSLRRTIVAALIAALAAAPALGAGYGVVERWRDPGFAADALNRILVVGITTDRTVRHRFEDKLVAHLRPRYTAETSYALVPDLDRLGSPGDVAQTLAEREVSAILMVQLVPLADDAAVERWAASWADSRLTETTARGALTDALASKTAAPRYAVEVGLWDSASRRRVWSARTEPHKRKAWRDGASEMVASVIAALREDQLLP